MEYNDQLQKATFNLSSQVEQRLVSLENDVRNLNNTLVQYFLKGRLRTDRTAPANSADVQTPDRLYDRVTDTSYEYILINNAGTLEWVRIAISTF
jgi:hypothetical protein